MPGWLVCRGGSKDKNPYPLFLGGSTKTAEFLVLVLSTYGISIIIKGYNLQCCPIIQIKIPANLDQ